MKKLFLTFCSTFALASLVSVFSNNGSAYANQLCTGRLSIGYECYEDGVINARTDYGSTLPFNGQLNAGSGFVITRVEFINESQFGSVSGPNIRKIQSGASVEVTNVLNQTSKLAEEVYNKARGEYKNLKYMIEIQDKLTKEMNVYRNYLSRVQSNVDTVDWDGSVSGRCVRYIFSRCVDSIGGKLEGKVRVHKLYIGTSGEYRSYAQSVSQRLDQAFALTREDNKPVSPPFVEQKTCFNVDSRQGWQTVVVNHKVASANYIEGGWSVDARSYSMVSYRGHEGSDAERLTPFNAFKYHPPSPFGALLIDLPDLGIVWVNEPSGSLFREAASPVRDPVFPAGSTFRLRINDADNALGDNGGSLRVCLVPGIG